MHKFLADTSRLLSRLTGGRKGTTLCHRAAMRWGYDCVFCKLVGFVLRQPTHCLEECEAHEIVAIKRRRK
jgi:hypothetical protein